MNTRLNPDEVLDLFHDLFHNNACRFLGQNPKWDINPVRLTLCRLCGDPFRGILGNPPKHHHGPRQHPLRRVSCPVPAIHVFQQ